MLGKLMKYEFKATWKLIVPMEVFVIVMSLFAYATIHMAFFNSSNELVEMTGAFVLMTYGLSMFVISVVTVIYLIYRFYISVYSDEGYLLHTLPVDKHHIIISKALVSAIWIISNIILIYLSVIFLLSSNKEIIGAVREGFGYYFEIINRYKKINGFTVIMTFVASFIAMFARILKVTACISLGQLSSNHKVLLSFGFYYAIYVVQRIFTMIYYTIITLVERKSGNLNYTSSMIGNGWEFTLISSLIYCVIFYFLTWYVMDKKLNLD